MIAEAEDEDDESRLGDEGTKRSSWTRSTLVTRIASILSSCLDRLRSLEEGVVYTVGPGNARLVYRGETGYDDQLIDSRAIDQTV